jgi:hypothetical protein|tara:strand:+ start:386 stop:874 length:489 start_codon:yes stop_codon:yes gene_type:complete
MKISNNTKIIIAICSILVILSLSIFHSKDDISSEEIAHLTDLWIQEVTEKNNPEAIGKLFCTDGNLVGTVSQIKRKGEDIKRYFDYFAKLPGIKVVSKKYNISKIVDNVYLNTAFITWSWEGLEKPITARMTFIYRNKCIFQLHSSALPELNKDLHKISQLK